MASSVSQRPQLFNFDAQGVRVVGNPEQPWFVAKDVCTALGLGADRVSDAVASLEDDEKGSGIVATLGGPQELLTVNESGLYALIFRSRKPSARLFRRWVTGTVLPAIRRSGAYRAAGASLPALAAAPALPLPLPPPPTIEAHIAHVLSVTVAFPRDHGLVHPVEIARAAVIEKRFPELISDPADHQQVSRFFRFVQGRGFLNRWLRTGEGVMVFCEPIAKNRHRRYSITVRREGGAA